MNRFDHLSRDAKVVFLLALSELIIKKISQSEGYEVAVESLKKSWEWVKLKKIEAYALYLYLENMDEKDIMTYIDLEDDCNREKVWICIGNALAYTVWEAYQYEKEKYLPQTIESVDDDTVKSFIKNFNEVFANSGLVDKVLYYLEENYPQGTSKRVDIKSLKSFINECI